MQIQNYTFHNRSNSKSSTFVASDANRFASFTQLFLVSRILIWKNGIERLRYPDRRSKSPEVRVEWLVQSGGWRYNRLHRRLCWQLGNSSSALLRFVFIRKHSKYENYVSARFVHFQEFRSMRWEQLSVAVLESTLMANETITWLIEMQFYVIILSYIQMISQHQVSR